MEKLSVIGRDVLTGANATYSFWKHIFQLLLELITFNYIQFEVEREHISESTLKDINGRYLKFKVKHPAASAATMNSTNSYIAMTPMGESLLAGDSQAGIEDFGDTSEEFLDQIRQLNEMWYVFAALAFLFALGAFFIQRSLRSSQSIKANFANKSQPVDAEQPAVAGKRHNRTIFTPAVRISDEQSSSGGPVVYNEEVMLSAYGHLPDKIEKVFDPHQQVRTNQQSAATQDSAASDDDSQQANSNMQPLQIIIKAGDLETIHEDEAEEFTATVEATRLREEEQKTMAYRQPRAKKNFTRNVPNEITPTARLKPPTHSLP